LRFMASVSVRLDPMACGGTFDGTSAHATTSAGKCAITEAAALLTDTAARKAKPKAMNWVGRRM